MKNETERHHIEGEIARNREAMGNRIDELDRHLRKKLDVNAFAGEHATELVAGGLVLGFFAGFGVPALFRRVIQIGAPVAMIIYRAKKARDAHKS